MIRQVIELFEELYRYRTLVGALIVRHLSSRYRGSVLGFLWSFLNPLCLMLVYLLVFRYYIRFTEVENYTIFLFCGLLPWIWISSGLLEGSTSVVSSGHLITKSMFPAQVLPAVAVLTSMVNYLLSLPLLFIIMLFSGVMIPFSALFLPLLCVLQALLLFGFALILAALNVYYRDVQHVVGNFLTFAFFLCPILYPREVVPEAFHFTLDLNPFALLTESYQQVLLEGVPPTAWALGYIMLWVVIGLVSGAYVFRHYRERFAEAL